MAGLSSGTNRLAEAIKSKLPLEEYAGRFTTLKKSSKEYVGLCPLPNHKEKTPSFYINAEKQLWMCQGCKRGGDIITLRAEVEGVTNSESMRRFAEELKLQFQVMTPDDEIIYREKQHKTLTYDICLEKFLGEMKLEHYDFLNKKYGISIETAQAAKIGFSGKESLFEDFDLPTRMKTGFFKWDDVARKSSYFIGGRIMFPNFWQGSPVHFTNRDANPDGDPKYKSLNPFSSITVTSDDGLEKKEFVTWAESSVPYFVPEELIKFKDALIIVEGIGDALALAELGFAAMATKTNRLLDKMMPFLSSYFKSRKFKNIVIWGDFDPKSGSGKAGAIETFELLLRHGHMANVLIVKHSDPARRSEKCDPADFIMSISSSKEERTSVVMDIIKKAKKMNTKIKQEEQESNESNYEIIDVIRSQIDELEMRDVTVFASTKLKLIEDELVREFYIKCMVEKFDGMTVSKVSKLCKTEDAVAAEQDADVNMQRLNESEGEKAYALLKKMGVNFFYDRQTKDLIMIHATGKYSLIDETNLEMRTFLNKSLGWNLKVYADQIKMEELRYSVFSMAARIEKKGGWLAENSVIKGTVDIYLSVSDQDGSMTKINPYTIERVQNPDSKSGVVLNPPHNIKQFAFRPLSNEEYTDGLKKYYDLMLKYMPFEEADKWMFLCWALAAPLRSFADQHPIFKIFGEAGSGKTTGFKLLSALFYNDEKVGGATTASLYQDAENMPFLFIDNMESISPEMQTFLLTGSTSGKRTKMGSSKSTVEQSLHSNIAWTAIQPATTPELVTRILEIEAKKSLHNPDYKSSYSSICNSVMENRDHMMSTWMHLIQRVMQLDIEVERDRIKKELLSRIASKDRMSAYISLMVMIMVQVGNAIGMTETQISDIVKSWIVHQEKIAIERMAEASSVAVGLSVLENIATATMKREGTLNDFYMKHNVIPDHVKFIKNQTTGDILLRIEAPASMVHNYVLSACRSYNINFPIKESSAFGSRLSTEEQSLKNKGWIFSKKNGRNSKIYTLVKFVGKSKNPSAADVYSDDLNFED